ncbi:hypothetical protein EWM64_g6733 [Hericium alpestre]|uniref:Tail specific protease domain-containing protein n=1 Tax=Hericium alpestre TaxID=135208 RepID=A0A4Y9ZSS1_9AGAM|nr:hypothetical protein EWM64_g6733 [Hericium alpestre]
MKASISSATLAFLLTRALPSSATSDASDPCAKIAGLAFVPTADAIACQKAFPFNETLRQNVLTVISRVFDFFTFEDYYLDSPAPFQESTTNIRADIARINQTKYETDFDFNADIYNFTTKLNDGHTRWFPNCYNSYQNILPAPVVSLEEDGVQNVFIAPDSVEFLELLGSNFTSFFDSKHFDWRRLAGAKVLEIEGLSAYDYIDVVASTVSGNYLPHGPRVNSAFSSYRIDGTNAFSQRIGDVAGPELLTQTELTFKLITVNSTREETVTVPFLANFIGTPFTDKESFWANNCAANDETNGVDLRLQSNTLPNTTTPRRRARAAIIDSAPKNALGLPAPFLPTLPPVNSSAGVIKSFILPDNKTGVMFLGSFDGDFNQFQTDTLAAITQFQQSNVTHLLLDLTNNGGGFVCLGFFLHSFLAGTDFGYPGFQSTSRANPLAQRILAADIAQGIGENIAFYAPDNWAFLNDTAMPLDFNYNDPSAPLTINGRSDPTSIRFHDICTPFAVPMPATPPFDLKNVAIVSNGDCASTCAMFSTLMNERHNTTIAVFGGKPGEAVEFKGMAGNQVLEWSDLDTEIKTAGLKDAFSRVLLLSANWFAKTGVFQHATQLENRMELP